MEFDKTPAPAVVEVSQEVIPAASSRSRIGRILKGAGLGVLLYAGATAGRAAIHETAKDTLENERTPEVLQGIHARFDRKANIDANLIASQIAKNMTSERVHNVQKAELEGIFSPDQMDAKGRVIIEGKPYNLKLGSSGALENHFVVAGRSKSEMIHPHLIGMYINQAGEVTLEEGQYLALQNAADNLKEAREALNNKNKTK